MSIDLQEHIIEPINKIICIQCGKKEKSKYPIKLYTCIECAVANDWRNYPEEEFYVRPKAL